MVLGQIVFAIYFGWFPERLLYARVASAHWLGPALGLELGWQKLRTQCFVSNRTLINARLA